MFRKNHLSGRPHVVNSPKNTSLKSNTTKIKIKITSQEWRNYNIATEARFLIIKNGWSPANIYWFEVNNENRLKRCEICSHLTKKKKKLPERRQ